MAKPTLSEKISKSMEVEPEDFDPEDFENANYSSNSESEDQLSEDDRTSHYVDVAQSRLRDDGIALTEGKYKGQKISRDQMQDNESSSSSSESESENENANLPPSSTSNSGIAQILNDEQKQILAQLSADKNSDASKGKSVFAQHKIYENLLDLRIQIQKLMQMAQKQEETGDLTSLLNAVMGMRAQLANKSYTKADSLADINAKCQQMDAQLAESRDLTLAKWSRKVQMSSGSQALNKLSKLGQTSDAQVKAVLADMPRLEQRTKVDRQNLGITTQLFFDDSDFYKLLLKDLVDRRMADSTVSEGLKWQTKVEKQSMKQKKKVDVKASKGRRLRYDINEKIQGFDAPRRVYKWSEQQADDLYSGLLGVKISMDDHEQPEEEQIVPDDGFTIFG